MVRNPITNKYELNLQETNLMAKLDRSVALGEPKAIETPYGDVEVRMNVCGGFTASICNENYFDVVFSFSASEAFLKLAEKIQEKEADCLGLVG